ncbi:MAG: DUF6471 domain-containing protein [Rhodocyclaceae bacterium]
MNDEPATDLKSLPYWQVEAKGILKAELQRRGVTYAKLARLMQANAMHETERSLANKISRGSFSFVFFLQVMRVLKVTHLSLAPTEAVASVLYSGQPAQFWEDQDPSLGRKA